MTLKIGLVGGDGVGKSTLAYSFSNFVEKRGSNSGVANFDAACKHILFRPLFDIRLYYSVKRIMREEQKSESEAMAEIYRRALADSVLNTTFRKACLEKNVLLLDIAGPLEYFLLQGGKKFLQHFCDRIVFVTDYNAVRDDEQALLASALNSLQEGAYGLPTVTFVNKCDVLEKKKKRLLQKLLVAENAREQLALSYPQPISIGGKVIKGSATEGLAFRELFAALEL